MNNADLEKRQSFVEAGEGKRRKVNDTATDDAPKTDEMKAQE